MEVTIKNTDKKEPGCFTLGLILVGSLVGFALEIYMLYQVVQMFLVQDIDRFMAYIAASSIVSLSNNYSISTWRERYDI